MSKCSFEREAKLSADSQFVVPDLRDLVKQTVRLPEQRLLAAYFDTTDLRLWARQITLRHRIGEDISSGIWTLKLPRSVDGPILERIEHEWAGPRDVIPHRASDILLGVARRAPLRVITSLETTRRRLILQDRNQRVLAELDDDLVMVHGGPHDGERFRQIEIELDKGDDELLEQCVNRLRRAGARLDDRGPKLARALDDESAQGRGGLRSLEAKSTIGDVVRVSIESGFHRVLDHEYLLRVENSPPPHAIHQTRVATRRLRSDLKTFKSVLDPVWVNHLRHDLEWLGDALGRVRDADVLGDGLGLSGQARMEDTKGVTGLRQELRVQRSAGAQSLQDVLRSERYLLLLDKLHAASTRPPFLARGKRQSGRDPVARRAVKALPRMVQVPWKGLQKEVRRAGQDPTDGQLHKIRIRAKQLRYAAEAAAPIVGKQATRTAQGAERLQTQLGEHHDAVIAEEWLRRRAKGASSAIAFSAGQLASEQRRRQEHVRAHWSSHWRKVNRRARTWLA